MPDYTVLIVGQTDRWWTSMSEAELTEGYAHHTRFNEALAAGGHQVVGGGQLTATTDARSIPAGGGPVTEGPFAETAEQVGGYYQVSTDDLAGLLECCQVLAQAGDGVEVRPNVARDMRPE